MQYSILLRHTGTRFTAAVPLLPGCVCEGGTREEVLARIRQAIVDHLQNSEWVHLEVPEPAGNNPWLNTFGRSAEDPDVEAVQAEIARYRQEQEET